MLVHILSTKIIPNDQKERLLHAGMHVVGYNAIRVQPITVDVKEVVPYAIFTSKNAVKAIEKDLHRIAKTFCVGTETQKLLVANECDVVATAPNAAALAHILVTEYQSLSFVFFCGNNRRDELPSVLRDHQVLFQEKIVYHTRPCPKEFHRIFDGVLFFSPSAVHSYMACNSMGEQTVAFCIGATTARAVRKYTDNIVIANTPTVSNVVVQVVKYFDKRYDKK